MDKYIWVRNCKRALLCILCNYMSLRPRKLSFVVLLFQGALEGSTGIRLLSKWKKRQCRGTFLFNEEIQKILPFRATRPFDEWNISQYAAFKYLFKDLELSAEKNCSSVILLTIQCPSWKRMLHHRGKWQMADLFNLSCPPHLSTNKCVIDETNPWDWKTLASKKNMIYQEAFLVAFLVYPGLPKYWEWSCLQFISIETKSNFFWETLWPSLFHYKSPDSKNRKLNFIQSSEIPAKAGLCSLFHSHRNSSISKCYLLPALAGESVKHFITQLIHNVQIQRNTIS